MKLLLLATIIAVAAAIDLKGSQTINVYGVSPAELAKETLRGTDFYAPPGVITQKFLGVREIFEKPLLVFAPSQEHPEFINSYFVYNGLRSIKDLESFKGLYEYFKTTPDLVGFVFYPKGIYNIRFLDTILHHNYLPENFKVADFLKVVDEIDQLPILFVLPKEKFESYQFSALTEVARFGVFDNVIEPVPVAPAQVIKTVPIH